MFGQYKVSESKDNLNLGCGQPGPEFMSRAFVLFNESSQNKIQSNLYDIMQYGKKDGHDIFKLSIIQEMFRNLPDVKPENIFMTNGVSQGILMITNLLRFKISTIYVEELTYFIMLTHFADLKLNIKTFSLDKLEEFKPSKTNMVYIIPFCNNPTGKTITTEQLEKFINIVDEYKLTVLSDETYYKMQNTSIKPLYLYSPNCISFHTFSKIYAPAVRLGWLMTQDNSLLNRLNDTGFIDSGGSVNPLMGFMISMVITGNYYPQFLKMINYSLNSRRELICQVLDLYPDVFTYYKPDGGYFIFVKINEKWGIDSDEFLEICKLNGITFHQGWKFTTPELKEKYKNYFRLSCSYYYYYEILKFFAERMEKIINELYKKNKNIWILGHKGRLGTLICKELEFRSMKWKPINRDFQFQHITNNDVIVDVSSPKGTETLLEKLQEKKYCPTIIIGTTGNLPDKLIQSYPGKIMVRSNFSEGIPLVLSFLDNFDKLKWPKIEIKDFHHKDKKDLPSGTTKSIVSKLEENTYNNEDISIVSYRDGLTIGIHEIILSNEIESITIKHEVKDRRIFAIGCVNLICKFIV